MAPPITRHFTYTSTRFRDEEGAEEEYTTEGEPLFEDNDGAAYHVRGRQGIALKVLHNNVRTAKAQQRLEDLISRSLEDQTKTLLSWPIDIVLLSGGFSGFVMTYMEDGVPINKLYDRNSSLSRNKRVRVAQNLCVSVDVIHSEGIICGDLSPSRILVDPHSCRVFLKDGIVLDNPSVNRLYSQFKWVAEFLAPEVNSRAGNSLQPDTCKVGNLIFSSDSDNFALAVHIFALFMNGLHPYDYTLRGKHAIRNLSENRSASKSIRPLGVLSTRPKFSFRQKTYPISRYRRVFWRLPAPMRACIRRAFDEGLKRPNLRPDAKTWFDTLDMMHHNLRVRASLSSDRVGYIENSNIISEAEEVTSEEIGHSLPDNPIQTNIARRSTFLTVISIFTACYIFTILLSGAFLSGGDLISSFVNGAASSAPIFNVSWGYTIMGCAGALFGFLLYFFITRRNAIYRGYRLINYLLAAVSTALFSFAIPVVFQCINVAFF